VVEKLRQDLSNMVAKTANAEKENQATKDALLKEAHRIGDDFLQVRGWGWDRGEAEWDGSWTDAQSIALGAAQGWVG
jgi:hypothetical protein